MKLHKLLVVIALLISETTLDDLFEAKFSEALKTVGKKFDFTELYEARREFRDEIMEHYWYAT